MGMVAVAMIILAGACLALTRPYHVGSATPGVVRPPNGTIQAIRRGIVDVRLTMVVWHRIHAVPSLRGPSDQVRVITTLGYRNQALCYSRTVAYSSGSAMLFFKR
jgi:hypothetical protein